MVKREKKRHQPELRLIAGPRGRREKPRPTAAVAAPSMPTWLGGEAKAEWKRVVAKLESIGVITQLDRAVLAAYCTAWGDFYEATRVLERDGMLIETPIFARDTGKEVGKRQTIHPAVALQRSAQNNLRRYANELGLTPTARRKSKIKNEFMGADPLDALLRRNNPIQQLMDRGKRPTRNAKPLDEPGPYGNTTNTDQTDN